MNVVRGNWVVVFDAGGTSTKAALLNRKGETVADLLAESFNLRQQRIAQFIRIVVDTIRKLFNEAHLSGHVPAAIAAGVAGAGRASDREELAEMLRDRFPNTLVLVHHDAFIAHWGAFQGKPGVLVTSGTGSIAFGRNGEGEEARAGGWGWLLGDEGSGWWIGREALRSALAADEGSGPPTRIVELVRDSFPVEQVFDVISHVYSESFRREQISALSPGVAELAREGDDIAQDILLRAGRELGGLAAAAGLKLAIPPRDLFVALLGAVGSGGGEWIEEGVRQRLVEYEGLFERFHGAPGPDMRLAHGAPAPLHAGEVPPLPATQKEGEDRRTGMPEFPPKDTTLPEEEPGPRLVEPAGDALQGAAFWVMEELHRRSFA